MQLLFLLTLFLPTSILLIFHLGVCPSCNSIYLRDLFSPNIPENILKMKYTFPRCWNNLISGRRTTEIPKQHNSLK